MQRGLAPVPKHLDEVISRSYPSRGTLLAAVNGWSREHASETGVGFFGVKLQTWRITGRTRGCSGYVKCRVKQCPWNLMIEESQDGSICVYDHQLVHSDAGHNAPEAPRAQLAVTPGFHCIPAAFKTVAELATEPAATRERWSGCWTSPRLPKAS